MKTKQCYETHTDCNGSTCKQEPKTQHTAGELFADRNGQIYNQDGKTVAITYKDAELAADLVRHYNTAPDLLAVVNEVAPHCKRVAEKSKSLQYWLHESDAGKALDEVNRATISQILAELFTLTSGSKLPTAARNAIERAEGKAGLGA